MRPRQFHLKDLDSETECGEFLDGRCLGCGRARETIPSTYVKVGRRPVPLAVGRAGDALAAGAALAWAAWLFATGRRSAGRGAALTAAGVPAVLLLALFGSYVRTASEPRWRSWPVDSARFTGPLVQEIRLQEPLTPASCRSAYWLADLRLAPGSSLPLAAMNGERLTGRSAAWTRYFCTSALFQKLPDKAEAYRQQLCFAYRQLAEYRGPLSSWPQWWVLPVAAERVRGRRIVSLALERPPDAQTGEVWIGATIASPGRPLVYGPSPRALTPNAWSSMYRWEQADDWRFWEETPVKSIASRGHPSLADAGRVAGPSPESEWLAAERLHLNVRLLVREPSGAWVVY